MPIETLSVLRKGERAKKPGIERTVAAIVGIHTQRVVLGRPGHDIHNPAHGKIAPQTGGATATDHFDRVDRDFGIRAQFTVRKNGSLNGIPSTMTSVLTLVLVPNPRMLKVPPVGCNSVDGMVGTKTPGDLVDHLVGRHDGLVLYLLSRDDAGTQRQAFEVSAATGTLSSF